MGVLEVVFLARNNNEQNTGYLAGGPPRVGVVVLSPLALDEFVCPFSRPCVRWLIGWVVGWLAHIIYICICIYTYIRVCKCMYVYMSTGRIHHAITQSRNHASTQEERTEFDEGVRPRRRLHLPLPAFVGVGVGVVVGALN